jgi:hypothetical protein
MTAQILRVVLAIGFVTATASCGSQGTGASPPAATAPATSAAAPTGACEPDPVKICEALGGKQQAPAATAMGAPYASTNLPETLLLDVPGGPTIQVMCYYNPLRTGILRAELSSPVDANGIRYLREKNFCRGG